MKSVAVSAAVLCLLLTAGRPCGAQDCAWRPWAASWSNLNKGNDLFPPNDVYDPTNWDYSFSQATVLNMSKDTPPGGGSYAFHFFFDSQPPATSSQRSGSGGVYQEIAVTPGTPIQYSYYWKGKGARQYNWFEFLLVDGPFTIDDADKSAANWIMRKRELENSSFGWEQLTHTSTAYQGSGGPTITPTGNVVTVILKAGHNPTDPQSGVEAFFDRVFVSQDGVTNLIANGDFEDAAQAPVCEDEYMWQDPSLENYWTALGQCPADQHTTTGPVLPASNPNTSDTTLTIGGTWLELVNEVRLVPVDGGAEIVATSISAQPASNATSLIAELPTTGAADGVYDVVTVQAPSPPCLTQTLDSAFTITCPNAAVFSVVSPDSAVRPDGPVTLRISGENLSTLTGASLDFPVGNPPDVSIAASSLVMDGNDLLATFDLTCMPEAGYRLVGTRSDGCRANSLDNAFFVLKTPPADACAWQPWAAAWSSINTGADIDPPNEIYDPTNWDYNFSQSTILNAAKDTPPGGGEYALHYFLDGQPPDGQSNAVGSGGVYQEIAVEPGVPLEYSFYWKGACTSGASWFELLLIDGPFSLAYADRLQEQNMGINNPAMVRKRSLADGGFGWEQITDQTPADEGPAGPRPQTITPTGTTATIVLKAGRNPGGAVESFWDNVEVRQNGGANLVRNGTFENTAQHAVCNSESMFKDACEFDYWRRSTFRLCNDPFADWDADGDVDQADFAELQLCLTGTSGPIPEQCQCFERTGDDHINQADVSMFEVCASGPSIAADTTCDD